MMNKKNLKSLRNDKRAVSPVIGVILMVAITVILAAVIAAFVFGYGGPTAAPQASLKLISATAAGGTVTLEHQGGDGIVFANTRTLVTQDIGTPSTKGDGGYLVYPGLPAFEAGSADVFEPGEHAENTALVTGMTSGKTCRVEIFDTPSSKIIFSGTITVVT